MKQSIPTPVAIILSVLVLGGLGFFLYSHFLASPASDDKQLEIKGPMRSAPGQPMTKEEAMKMYHGGK